MSTTKRVPREEWKSYFERFTEQWLRDEMSEAVRVEADSEEMGAQVLVEDARLHGITWDQNQELLDLAFDEEDHIVMHPVHIDVIEEEDGFVSAIHVELHDGAQEIIQVRRHAPMVAQPS